MTRYKDHKHFRTILKTEIVIDEQRDGVQRAEFISLAVTDEPIGTIRATKWDAEVRATDPVGNVFKQITGGYAKSKDAAFTAARRWLISQRFNLGLDGEAA